MTAPSTARFAPSGTLGPPIQNRQQEIFTMKRYVALSALAIALATPAAAQFAPGAPFGGPVLGAPMSTEGFRQMALMSDSFEITAAQIAMQKSRNAAVNRFARMTLQHHQQTTAALSGGGAYADRGLVGGLVTAPLAVAGAATGAAVGVVGGTLQGGPVGGLQGAGTGAAAGARAFDPDSTASAGYPVSPEQRRMLEDLQAAPAGAAFDRLYAQYQVQAHQQAVASFAAYSQTGGDPAMRAFATQALPTLQQHLAAAERLPGGRAR
jgi:predicted outer membrane protein